MTAIKNVTSQQPKPRRKRQVVEEYDLVEEPDLKWEISYMRDRNEELKADNRLLRKLVAQLSLEKLKAEMGP
jgi:hypothetical protein